MESETIILILSLVGLGIATICAIVAKESAVFSNTRFNCEFASLILFVFAPIGLIASAIAACDSPYGYREQIIRNEENFPVQITYSQDAPYVGTKIKTVNVGPMQTKILKRSKIVGKIGIDHNGQIIKFDEYGRKKDEHGEWSF